MFETAALVIYRAITPLHCGGLEGGGVDLPVVRERHTRFPIIPATSLKGVWRDLCARQWQGRIMGDEPWLNIAFGPDPGQSEQDAFGREASGPRRYAGCLGFTDARLLFLPVRASRGTFVMITCPLQIKRLLEARALAGLPRMEFMLPTLNDARILDLDGKGNFGKTGETIYLEDVELTIAGKAESHQFGWAPAMPDRLCERRAMVSDATFKWFAENALEVVAHNQLNPKTKQSENLWYEEAVPAESLFFAPILSGKAHHPDAEDDACFFLDEICTSDVPFFQVGGGETTGRGLMAVSFYKGVANRKQLKGEAHAHTGNSACQTSVGSDS